MSIPLSPEISIIVPLYNEAPNLHTLVERTLDVMRPMGRPFELILIDDGSTDNSHGLLRAIKSDNLEVRVILLRRNFGQSAAMTAGFDYARGDIVVTMDGDLQNDPKNIPLLISKLEERYDLVNGWRKDRHDPFISRRLPSMIANRLIGIATGVRLHDYGCSLKAYRGDLAKNLLLYGELHRFIPVLAGLYGARIGEVVVSHHPRSRGKSKYGIGRTYRVILDLILMLFFQKFATRPLQLFGLSGGVLFISGFIIELYLTWLKLWHGQDIGGRPLLLLGALLIITGIVLGGIGLCAELVTRTYYESSGKRIYAVREVLE
ncbi:MAG: glycosyltransferase family 2 protein [Proteobacteria bacterium]|nr:glycosyltransferase family 2 protein [Desulfobacterales bacterium]MBL6967782.1 glycosyltransferase family 2 protein [Desulfobacteraceae bacterium]MBU0990252.1 glycosyltransferase family 2 protein [Pseudomonadota bacterium]MBL7101627.1 glycosyltransferase family 2 protein [Desulfobacteraceae bacterium]MBL7172274.1 glycosyltransferase family 2 protein [Desulfobacteraceae bacterium]